MKLAKCKLCGNDAIAEMLAGEVVGVFCSSEDCPLDRFNINVALTAEEWNKLNEDTNVIVKNAEFVFRKLRNQGYFVGGGFLHEEDDVEGWECPLQDLDICHEGFYDGRDDCCDRCPMRLLAEAIFKPETTPTNGFSNTFVEWLAHGKRGSSSNSIATKLSGVNCCKTYSSIKAHPNDPADLIRCVELLKAVPEFNDRLHEMKDVSPVWDVLVSHWKELEELLENDLHVNPEEAPCTNRRMKELIEEGEANHKPDCDKPEQR